MYVEPFFGSGAILLDSPTVHVREVVCDTDGHICNFWRAMRSNPDQVAYYAHWPTVHQDLQARQHYLMQWAIDNKTKLETDPHYFDSKAAGYYAWGLSNWIGGRYTIQVSKQIPYTSSNLAGQGVQVNRKSMESAEGNFDGKPLQEWFRALAKRLQKVVVLNRDFMSALTPQMLGGNSTNITKARVQVFLDPPYRQDKGRDEHKLYASDVANESTDIATRAYKWAIDNGDKYAIGYCMHEGDFTVPSGWDKEIRKFNNIKREVKDCIIFSPLAQQNKEQNSANNL